MLTFPNFYHRLSYPFAIFSLPQHHHVRTQLAFRADIYSNHLPLPAAPSTVSSFCPLLISTSYLRTATPSIPNLPSISPLPRFLARSSLFYHGRVVFSSFALSTLFGDFCSHHHKWAPNQRTVPSVRMRSIFSFFDIYKSQVRFLFRTCSLFQLNLSLIYPTSPHSPQSITFLIVTHRHPNINHFFLFSFFFFALQMFSSSLLKTRFYNAREHTPA